VKCKRICCILLVFVVFSGMGSLYTPPLTASATAGTAFLGTMNQIDIRFMKGVIQEYAKIGALELKLAAGGLSAAAAAKGNLILAQMKASVAATGITAAKAATMASAFAVAGIVVVTVDFGAVWNSIFNRADFLTTYEYRDNAFAGIIANYTRAESFVEGYLKMVENIAGGSPFEWTMKEINTEGWQIIGNFFSGIFGSEKGEQTLLDLPLHEVLSLSTGWFAREGVSPTQAMVPFRHYVFPTHFSYEDRYGQKAWTVLNGNNIELRRLLRGESEWGSHVIVPATTPAAFRSLPLIDDFQSHGAEGYMTSIYVYEWQPWPLLYPSDLVAQVGPGYWNQGGYRMMTTPGAPAMEYTRTYDPVTVPVNGDTVTITMPTVDYSAATTDEQKLHLFTQALQTWEPFADTAPLDPPVTTFDIPAMIAQIDIANSAIAGVLDKPMTQEQYREMLENMKEWFQHINGRLRTDAGALTQAQLQELWDILQRLQGKVKAGELTQAEADTMIQALLQEAARVESLAKELGYTGTIAQSGINWGKVSTAWGGLASVFPFCIPFDIIGMFRSFEHDARPLPPIDVNILPFMPGETGRIQMDLIGADFEPIVRILRIFLFLGFCVGLMILTGKVIRW
jgi:hypothetical protein